MSNELLPYYERELAIMRDLAAEFAARHPKIAARLSIGRDDSQDPHVERLLQGFAFLTARVHKRLDDDYPELCQTLLEMLYPHYVQPVPSMTVVGMAFDPKQAAVTVPHIVPRGTLLETEPVDDENCQFRTCFDVPLQPMRITSVKLEGPPFQLPILPQQGTAAILTIEIETLSDAITIGQLDLGTLRFHLHSGSGRVPYELYELLLSKCLGIVVSEGPRDRDAVFLPPERLRPAGFEPDEATIPCDSRSFPGYRLLTELFALPRKFLFVDLAGLDRASTSRFGRRMQIAIQLSTTNDELEKGVTADTVRLGCTPVVNLFHQRLDPVRLDGRATEISVIPDARRPLALEVHSIKQVRFVEVGGGSSPVGAFHEPTHRLRMPGGSEDNGKRMWWTAARRPRRSPRPDGTIDLGTDLWMSLVDEDGGPAPLTDGTLIVEAECVNRNLPSRLPFTVGRPRMTFREGHGVVGQVLCLHAPTATVRPDISGGAAWRLLSHLSLNHLSLVDADELAAAEVLREILQLYLLEGTQDFHQKSQWVQGLICTSSRRVAGRVPGPEGGICRGLEVRLLLDEERFADGAAYLFASVIERFLGSWVTLNSFTRLVAASKQRESRREEWRWPPRSGNRVLA